MRLQVDGAATVADGVALWPVYDAVFGDHASYESWRDAVWDRHRARTGFRLARAHTAGGTLVGFAYGYTGERGQWWTDHAREALPPEVADDWLGGHFELVSIGVLAGERGRGIGRRLLRVLFDGTGHDRLVLMATGDGADPARRLYATEGWRILGPGVAEETVILGKRRA